MALVEIAALSCAKYALRRGVSKMAVSEAIKTGRLKACVVRGEPTPSQPLGPVLGISDPFLADKEWEANTDLSRLPSDERLNAKRVAEESAAKLQSAGLEQPKVEQHEDPSDELKSWQARLAELKYREAAAELVPARDVEKKIVMMIAACKTRLLAIPSALKQACPDLTVDHVAKVDALVREALEDLAGPAADAE